MPNQKNENIENIEKNENINKENNQNKENKKNIENKEKEKSNQKNKKKEKEKNINNNNQNNNINNNKKTRRKITIPRIKDIQTTPDLSCGDINERVKLVKSKKELDELWERLTKNAKELEPEIDKRHGKPIYKRQLDDRTNINYRVDSKTGGETIDINSRNPKTNIKIHIDKGI